MNISDFRKCANCGLCTAVCRRKAISIDESGLFYRPVVDIEKCVDCSECARLCPVNGSLPQSAPLSAYCARHKNADIVKRSSSGGAFTALADRTIADGGAVVSAAFSEDHRRVEFMTSDELPVDRFRRSKYVESLVSDAFSKVENLLEQGRSVLFCGTPCQIAGLKAFLGKDYEKLLCCDFICGGLPSHRMYEEYLDQLRDKYHADITQVNFRPKTLGWRVHALSVDFANQKTYRRHYGLDPFFSAFIAKHVNVRDYCTECKFPAYHQSDIILADCWLYEKISGESDNAGVSLLIANTARGEAAISLLTDDMEISQISLERIAYAFEQHRPKDGYSSLRKAYLEEYAVSGVIGAGRKYTVFKGLSALKAHIRELRSK